MPKLREDTCTNLEQLPCAALVASPASWDRNRVVFHLSDRRSLPCGDIQPRVHHLVPVHSQGARGLALPSDLTRILSPADKSASIRSPHQYCESPPTPSKSLHRRVPRVHDNERQRHPQAKYLTYRNPRGDQDIPDKPALHSARRRNTRAGNVLSVRLEPAQQADALHSRSDCRGNNRQKRGGG